MISETKPIVSVVIATYNYGNFISEAIESVLNQDYPKESIEIIIVDDGSTDNTKDVVKRYEGRIRYVCIEHSRQAWAVKTGIELARGKYIFRLDADDIFLPGKIRKVTDILENNNDIVYVSHPVVVWYIEKNIKQIEAIPDWIKGHKVSWRKLLQFFYRNNRFIGGGSTITGRADIIKRIPIDKKEIGFTIDEYLVLSCARSGFAFFVDEPLSIWRIHTKNYSARDSKKRAEIDMYANQAILDVISNTELDEQIKILYALKTKISILKHKEFCNEKSLADILNLWGFILENIKVFGKDIFRIIRSYRVLQRSLPMFIVSLFRKS